MEIKNTLEVGMTQEITHTIKKEDLASTVESGAMDVLSTPKMIALMEKASFLLANENLKEGYSTVGTTVNIKHLAATPLGMNVTVKCEIIEIDRRRLLYRVECYDEKEKVGEGTHERFIVNEDSFFKKANEKNQR